MDDSHRSENSTETQAYDAIYEQVLRHVAVDSYMDSHRLYEAMEPHYATFGKI